jgi:release factor glutamine methyltransferase
MATSIAEAILQGTDTLRKAGVTEARREAGSLAAHVLRRDRSFILSHPNDVVNQDQLEVFRRCIDLRAKGEPLQYITGVQEFFGLDFEVTSDVLIPRPETELLVETALKLTAASDVAPLICDVGTGSGCIAISLLHELPEARAVAIDVSPAAISVAQRNAARHCVTERIDFILGDCFAGLVQGNSRRPSFDLIVSNPPYVSETALAGLQREVRDFEPRSALAAGADGLSIIRRLLLEAGNFLKNGGHFLFEIGFDQSATVEQLIDRQHWSLVEILKDLQGIPRIVVLQRLEG